MRFIVVPLDGKWRWRLVDDDGEVHVDDSSRYDTPREARAAAKQWRNRVYIAPVEMGT